MDEQRPDDRNHLIEFIAATVEAMRDQMVTKSEMRRLEEKMAGNLRRLEETTATRNDLRRLEEKMDMGFTAVRGDIERVALRLDQVDHKQSLRSTAIETAKPAALRRLPACQRPTRPRAHAWVLTLRSECRNDVDFRGIAGIRLVVLCAEESRGRRMRWSNAFIPTLRDNPADAESPAEHLLIRAGFVRRISPGVYAVLPLGQRTMLKIAAIVREEMDAIGAQEFQLPAMAHEGLFLETARKEIRSYKDLPQAWYAIHTKCADEPTLKAGLLRLRQFTMSTSCFLDIDGEGRERSFGLNSEACIRIFMRCGLGVAGIAAGSAPGEILRFLVRTEAGEATLVACACGYAASPELASSRLPAIIDSGEGGEVREVHTPGQKTIAEVSRFLEVPPSQQIKTLVYIADDRPVVFLVRGDHQLNEGKAIAAVGAGQARPALLEEMRAILGADAGSLGPLGLGGVPVFADRELQGRRGMVCGANRDDYHLKGIVPGVHFEPAWADLRTVEPGEGCILCGRPLEFHKATEVGRMSKSRGEQADAGAQVLTADGRQAPVLTGSGRVVLEQLMAAAVELHHDADGIVWPPEIAPFSVIVSPVTQKGEVKEAGERIYSELAGAGYETLLDDRPERPGVKFKDADLIGIPCRVVLGGENLRQGKVELFERATRRVSLVPVQELVPTLNQSLKSVAKGASLPPPGTS